VVVTHSYEPAGSFTVVLTATNGCGEQVLSRDVIIGPTEDQFRAYLPIVIK